jgi:multidrug efflux pump subunit AcrA (membrane-fusion protein)
MTICDPNEIYIKANITEGDIVSVTEGQKIRVTFDSFGDETFDGKVTSVSSLPTTSNGITTYAVTCQLDQANPQVKDGMNAQIEFIQLEHPDVLMIPNKAVSIDKGKQYVNVVTEHGGKKVYEKRAVTCGLSNGTYTEVSQGLEEGETVAVGKVAV